MTETEHPHGNETDIILYGGKGGVGKTTCAAAHALALSKQREGKTLVVSTDPAHSLGDAFERGLSGEPTEITDSLSAIEVDSETGQKAYQRVVEALADEFRDAGLRLGDDDLERLFESGLVPGGDEVAALEYIARYADAGYDHVVFDTAPTGHTLRLLDLPEVLGETLGVAGDVQRRVRRTAQAAKSVFLGPAAYWGASGNSDEMVSLQERVGSVGELLRDPSRTSFRVVLTPERMAIAEAERLVERLGEASVSVDCVVVNRVFENFEECRCERCQRDAERHRKRVEEIEERFSLPLRRVPQLEGEAQGVAALERCGEYLMR
ncbi:arsenic-transporting ATPase (plasmid) [Haloferax mediterranei ATCC 33500]|uniref:Anion-transporting ATPase n=1 Tax=Haloferax mediterranei (strain ATCC 33500 / DSM 1411 / JCM 8866 / NBRC 14739 / NCIMB 2177 / R-4) TaxID=523841 RepID=I3RAB7_HALMT|nr:ArsA family ATPase [Haloferax mediterranei]AFK21177.1 Anion-transporting ATPase [Haloferax mediterranei ATCC 33500]AHZ24704.1 arsenic ABC transporter ATPase [Haloferax mediterranei ATCC 33500]ELZ97487.1 anion-transporting ATPase [Haloferax mediterranei ATCC 33500]MDX5990221.1 ArsA family ATPase [Haloferax mediterranei ATCC 33500]QCQ76709.1 arsenic-transporting ATPase [Haloferax mediterranei ATCC 33500]